MTDLTAKSPGQALYSGLKEMAVWWLLIKAIQMTGLVFGDAPIIFGLVMELIVIPSIALRVRRNILAFYSP